MLKNLIIKKILSSTISSMKGKKRWLVIIVLGAAYIAKAAGLDALVLDDFVADLVSILQTTEG